MATYKKIKMNELPRAQYFHYFMGVGTTIEFTAKVDITATLKESKKQNTHLQSLLLFQLTEVLNSIENFRYDLLNGELIVWDQIVPTFLAFNDQTKLFFTLYAEMKNHYSDFEAEYAQTVKQYSGLNEIVPQGSLPKNVFNVSSIPWLHYEHFSSSNAHGNNKIIKMITLGKYEKENNKWMLPVTIQVSHAIVDGYHVSLFYKRLQERLNQK